MRDKKVRREFLRILKKALAGEHYSYRSQYITSDELINLMSLAGQQAVSGLVGNTIMNSESYSDREVVLNMIGTVMAIKQRNSLMDEAVVALCKELLSNDIRVLVFKGQTLSNLYQDKLLRQSGDIDFLIHHDDWDKAIKWVNRVATSFVDNETEKHISFQKEGVEYEMHRMLTAFTVAKHQHYWDQYVMPDVWDDVSVISINGYDVPTLSPTLNALYVFVHIFSHLIDEGVGLRQFCDWMVVLQEQREEIDKQKLLTYLHGLDLDKAYSGLGAVLTDYLGLKEDYFPFPISEKDHKKAPTLMDNLLVMGNFGHNISYAKERGVIHGIQHLARIIKQATRFGYYAPSEAWGRAPYMFRWWSKKIKNMRFL